MALLLACAVFIFLVVVLNFKVFGFPIFEAESVLMVQAKKSPTSIEMKMEDLKASLMMIRNHMALMKAEPVLRGIVEDLKLYDDMSDGEQKMEQFIEARRKTKKQQDDFDIEREKKVRGTIEALQKKHIIIESPAFTNLIVIKVRYKDLAKTAQIANELAERYINWHINFSHQEAEEILKYLEIEIGQAEKRLRDDEEILRNYKEENKIVMLSEETKKILKHLESVELDFVDTKIKQEELLKKTALMQEEIFMDQDEVTEVVAAHNPMIRTLEVELLNQEVELIRVQELYTDNSEQVKNKRKQVKLIEERLQKSFKQLIPSKMALATLHPAFQEMITDLIEKETTVGALEKKKKAIEKMRLKFEGDLESIPSKNMQMLRLTRNVEISERLYEFLLYEKENARLLLAKQTTENIKIISKALPPLKPKGQVKRLLFGLLVSLFIALALFFVLKGPQKS